MDFTCMQPNKHEMVKSNNCHLLKICFPESMPYKYGHPRLQLPTLTFTLLLAVTWLLKPGLTTRHMWTTLLRELSLPLIILLALTLFAILTYNFCVLLLIYLFAGLEPGFLTLFWLLFYLCSRQFLDFVCQLFLKNPLAFTSTYCLLIWHQRCSWRLRANEKLNKLFENGNLFAFISDTQ